MPFGPVFVFWLVSGGVAGAVGVVGVVGVAGCTPAPDAAIAAARWSAVSGVNGVPVVPDDAMVLPRDPPDAASAPEVLPPVAGECTPAPDAAMAAAWSAELSGVKDVV